MPNKTYNRYNEKKEAFFDKENTDKDSLNDFLKILNEKEFLPKFDDFDYDDENEYPNSLFDKLIACSKDFSASFSEDLQSGPSLSDQTVEMIGNFIETGLLFYCSIQNIWPDQKEKEDFYLEGMRYNTFYQELLDAAVSDPASLAPYFDEPGRTFSTLYNKMERGLGIKLENLKKEQEHQDWLKERDEKQKALLEDNNRKKIEEQIAREREELRQKEEKENEERKATEKIRQENEKAKELKDKAEKEFAEQSKDNRQRRFVDIRGDAKERYIRLSPGDDPSTRLAISGKNEEIFKKIASEYVDKNFGEGLTKQDAVDEAIEFVHQDEIRRNPGKEKIFRNFESARYDFLMGKEEEVQVKAAKDMLYFYRALNLYNKYPNANYQIPDDNFCSDAFIRTHLANPADRNELKKDKNKLLEKVNKEYEALYTKKIAEFEDKLSKENKPTGSEFTGERSEAAENTAEEDKEMTSHSAENQENGALGEKQNENEDEPEDKEMTSHSAENQENDALGEKQNEDEPEDKAEVKIEETEEERKIREENELKQKLVSELEKSKTSAAKNLKRKAAVLSNEKFGLLENAVNAKNSEEMVENMAKAFVIEYNASLKSNDFMYKRMGETPENEAQSFRELIYSNFTKEELSSPEFKKKLTSPDFSAFREIFDTYKKDSYQIQENKMKEAFRAAGIDPDNKYDLMRLEILNDKNKMKFFREDNVYRLLDDLETIKECKQFPAFGLTEQGKQTVFQGGNRSFADYVRDYAKGYSNLNVSSKNGIIESMKTNRLTIASVDGDPENTRFVTMGENGPMLSATVKELKANPGAFAENGFQSEKDLQKALTIHKNRVNALIKLPKIADQYTKKYLNENKDVKPENISYALSHSIFISEMQKLQKLNAAGELNPQTMAENFGTTIKGIIQSKINASRGIEEPIVEAAKTSAQLTSEEVKMATFITCQLNLSCEEDFINAVENGYLSFGTMDEGRGLFDASKGSVQIVKEMCQMIKSGGKVFLAKLHKGAIKEYKINISESDGKVTAADEEAVSYQLANDSKRQYMNNALKAVSNALISTGVSKGDSNEFKELKGKLNDYTVDGLPEDPGSMNAVLNDIKETAFGYFYAKLDQSQNSRRSERFMQAAKLIEVIDAFQEGRQPTLENVEKNIIASKAIKAQCMTALKSRNPEAIDRARRITKDSKTFNKTIKTVTSSDAFRAKFGNKTAEQLHKISTKMADKLSKEVQSEDMLVR